MNGKQKRVRSWIRSDNSRGRLWRCEMFSQKSCMIWKLSFNEMTNQGLWKSQDWNLFVEIWDWMMFSALSSTDLWFGKTRWESSIRNLLKSVSVKYEVESVRVTNLLRLKIYFCIKNVVTSKKVLTNYFWKCFWKCARRESHPNRHQQSISNCDFHLSSFEWIFDSSFVKD